MHPRNCQSFRISFSYPGHEASARSTRPICRQYMCTRWWAIPVSQPPRLPRSGSKPRRSRRRQESLLHNVGHRCRVRTEQPGNVPPDVFAIPVVKHSQASQLPSHKPRITADGSSISSKGPSRAFDRHSDNYLALKRPEVSKNVSGISSFRGVSAGPRICRNWSASPRISLCYEQDGLPSQAAGRNRFPLTQRGRGRNQSQSGRGEPRRTMLVCFAEYWRWRYRKPVGVFVEFLLTLS